MPSTLTATPNIASSLTATAIVADEALYPGFYPDATAYPGRGGGISATSVSAATLTATPA